MFFIKDYKSNRLRLKIMNEKKVTRLHTGLETIKCENK